MRTRATLVALVLAAGLAGSAGVAIAGDSPPHGPSPEQIAHRCDRAEHRLDRLNRIGDRLADRIAKIEGRIASGELTGEHLEKAQARLARLDDRQAKLAQRIERLSGKIAEKCSSESTPA